MEPSTQVEEAQDEKTLSLLELAIYIINPGMTPSLINPEFLRVNEIVEGSWILMRPVVLDGSSSTVRYQNGVSVTATNSQVVISQRAPIPEPEGPITPLIMEDILSPRVATQLIQVMPTDGPYELVTIDPVGFMAIADDGQDASTSPLRHVARRIPFEETIPDVQTRALYSLDDKEVTLITAEFDLDGNGEPQALQFSGEFRRSVVGNNRQEQIKFVENVLNNWKQDIEEFNKMACRFHSMYTSEEN